MAEKEPAETIDSPPESPPAEGKGFGVMGVVKVAAFLVVVVAAECLVAIWVFPSAAETQAQADAMLAGMNGGDQLPVEPEETSDSSEPDKIEVDLGEFNVASYQPASQTTLQIDFHLYATVLTEKEARFKQLMEEKEQRVRDQVLTTVRSASISDLTDAGLGLVKRKILETTNRTLGEQVLHDVVFSDFSWVER
jgi:flagellar FliL protein